MNAMLQVVPLSELKEHPGNPRKHFDERLLTELTDSIRERGVLNPLLVRKNGHGFEILGGARRFRAAQRAGLEEVPVLIRELDDVAALEVIVVDNLQRDDVHPLEEAEGYAALMKAAGYDVEQIAGKIGRSTKYVYDRVKLLDLVPELRKVFVEGEITAGHAILLARLSAAEQRQVLGVDGDENEGYEDGWHRGGLFKSDYGSPDPVLDLGDVDEDEEDGRKAVSVRELETHIREHVRFHPEDIDLPNLFPETAAALEQATTLDIKVVHITWEHRVADSARTDTRTYGRQTWKRADGEEERGPYDSKGKKSKTCEHSVLGLIVAGAGRGHAFPVCVRKDKCTVHWGAEIKEREKRATQQATGKSSSSKLAAAKKPSWQIQQEKRDAERARWKPAMRDLGEAAVEAIKTTDPLKLFDLIDKELFSTYGRKTKRTAGTLEERVRAAVGLLTGDRLDRQYPNPEDITEWLRVLGIDAKKVVDRVSPKAKAEKPAKAEKAAPKKKGARARRREKKGAVHTSAEA